jgi:hypothetical protein
MEVNGQIHAPATLPPGQKPSNTHWIGGCVGPRVGLDAVAKRESLPLPVIETRSSSP